MRLPVAEVIKIGRSKLFNEVTGLGFFPLVVLKALFCLKNNFYVFLFSKL